MEVILIGNYLADRQPSMLRFVRLMASGLAAQGVDVEIVRPLSVAGRMFHARKVTAKWMGYIDKMILFPMTLKRLVARAVRRHRPTVFHVCDHSNAIYTRWLQAVPHLVTCHDLFAIRCAMGEIPQSPTRWSGRRLQAMILDGLKRAQWICCDSDATLRETIRLVAPDPVSSNTILLSLEEGRWKPQPETASEDWKVLCSAAGGAQNRAVVPFERFVLHVGGDAWYKNRAGALRIFSELGEQAAHSLGLVLVGPPPGPNFVRMIDAMPGLRDRVCFLQDLSDANLAVLYRAAEALLFPSLDEGFGWPVLEAHACGCLVVASRRGSLPEVGGKAAYYIDPDDEKSAAHVLRAILAQSKEIRASARAAALENAARFSIAAPARQYTAVYEHLLRRNGGKLEVAA